MKIIFITAIPSFEHAVEAIKIGAFDYLVKPFELAKLDLAIDRAIKTLTLEQVEYVSKYTASKEESLTTLIGTSDCMEKIRDEIKLTADAPSPILITGETGTGKNIVAKAIHNQSKKREKPFISINCSAIPETLIESELFGHTREAFTGAMKDKKGIFELANEGTLLLDEIGDMLLHLQSRLLAVLEEGTIRRIGGETTIPVNVKVIATTNADIEKLIAEKKFRADLYYRLSVIRITIPPLRERKDDIKELCDHFIMLFNNRPIHYENEQIELLKSYNWPGNVRELKNIIERALILQKGKHFRPADLLSNANVDWKLNSQPSKINLQSTDTEDTKQKLKTLEELERDYILTVLESLSGNKVQTAKALGISRATLKRKLAKIYGRGTA